MIKTLNINDDAKALEEVSPISLIYTTVAKPVVGVIKKTDVISVDVIVVSDDKEEFQKYLVANMTKENVGKIEKLTLGQKYKWNMGFLSQWCWDFLRNVLTKMTNVAKGGGHVDML